MKRILIILLTMLFMSSCAKGTAVQTGYDNMNLQMTTLPICGDMEKVYYVGYDSGYMIDINDKKEEHIIEKDGEHSIFDIALTKNGILYNSVGFNDYTICERDVNGDISKKFTISQQNVAWTGKDFIYAEEDNIYYFAFGDRVLYYFNNGEQEDVLNNVTAVCIGADYIYYGDGDGNICITDKQFSNTEVLWNKTQLESDSTTSEFYKTTNSTDMIIKDVSVVGDTIRFIWGNAEPMGSGILIELNTDGEYRVNNSIRVESYQYYKDNIIFSGYSLIENERVHGIFLKEKDNVRLLKELPVRRVWGTYVYAKKLYYGYNDYSNATIVLDSIEL